jgi:hypothetical protein
VTGGAAFCFLLFGLLTPDNNNNKKAKSQKPKNKSQRATNN